MITVDIHKAYQNSKFESHFQFELPSGSLSVVNGPSGSGKTTLLRMLCGLLIPDKGSIIVEKDIWFSNNINKSAQLRNVGYVPQDYALFPNMTVRQNLKYALRSNQSENIIEELLQLMNLTDHHDKYPHQLSGGQKQSTSLARSLVQEPKLMLLDEAFSAVDSVLSQRIQRHILSIQQELKTTFLMVSHQLEFIPELEGQLISIANGKVSSIKKIEPVYKQSGVIRQIKDGLATIAIEQNIVQLKAKADWSIGQKINISY
ncbi:MAG: ATP-binding cassette domain-containing protein [Cyclobacteriaceae bacterium]